MSPNKFNSPPGRWLVKGLIWRTDDARLWFTAEHLATDDRYKIVGHSSWFNWAMKYPCPHLDPKVNGGMVDSRQIPKPRGEPYRVFSEADADRVIERLTDPSARKADPGGLGRWIVPDEIFRLAKDVPEKDLPAGELLYRDELLAGEIGVKKNALGGYRQDGQIALPISVFGGRLRYQRVARFHKLKGGPGKVIVSSLSDGERIRDWREEQRRLAKEDGGRNGCTRAAIAASLKVKLGNRQDNRDLNVTLSAFRKDVPAGAWERVVWIEEQNSPATQMRYDLTAFIKWLGGRTVHAAAADLGHIETPRMKAHRAKHLRDATLFLMFALTRGRGSKRTFGQFVRDTPPGTALPPCDGVPTHEVKKLAKEVGIKWRELWAAKKTLPIVRDGGGRQTRSWRLTEPVVIPAADSASVANTNGQITTNDVPATPTNENFGPPTKTKRGPGAPAKISQADYDTLANWERAREAGVQLKDFAKDKGMKLTKLKAILSRVRMDRLRKGTKTLVTN
jgi:hypothetical protein